jgi:tetratricopeptide (TPR) repeat protein
MADKDKFDRYAQSDFHNQRGIELADRGWLDESIKEFRKAIELDGDSAHAHDNLATVLAEKGLLREALREYVVAIELEPQSPTAHYNLACFLATHAHELAVREYQETLALEWDYPDGHLNLGLTLAERGQFAEALVEYQHALALDPKDPVAKHEMATVMMDMGRPRDAIPHLREVVKNEADNLDAWVDLGNCYVTVGFYSEAEKALHKALELDEKDLMANYHMAALRAAQADVDACLASLTRAAAVDVDRVRQWVEGDRFFDVVRGADAFADLFKPRQV